MSTLQRHAERYRWNGFPIYGRWEDGEEGEIVGVIVEPRWKWADLSDDDRATVLGTAESYRADPRGSDLTEEEAFMFALGEFAVDCPHLRWDYHEPIYRECKTCRVVEQLPGRVVSIDGKPMRVSDDSPPLRLRIPRPSLVSWADPLEPPTPTLEVDEYEWRGNRYERLA